MPLVRARNGQAHAVLDTPVVSVISPVVTPPEVIASAAFLTRFSSTCTSWSRLPLHRRQRRIVDLVNADVRREAALRQPAHVFQHAVDVDRRRARSASRRTPPCGRPARGCGRPRRGSARSVRGRLSATLLSSNWAAPRMPDSGFFTSCARIAAMPVTLRAALRKVSCRSSARAAEASCSTSTHRARLLRQRRALHGDAVLVEARAFQRQVVVGDGGLAVARTCSISRKIGLSGGSRSASAELRELHQRHAEELLGGVVGEAEAVGRVEQHHRHRQRRQQRSSGRAAAARSRRPTTASTPRATAPLTPPPPVPRSRGRRCGSAPRAISGS